MNLRTVVLPPLLLLAFASPLLAAQTPPANRNSIAEPVRVAMDHLRNLEYDQATQAFQSWLQEHPGDLYAWNYFATTVLYGEMFRQGVLESKVYGEGGEVFKPSKVPVTPEFQKELLSVLDKAQAAADERLHKDPQDKDAMYWAGVTHGTRATYHFSLRKEYKAALREADAAYKLHSDLLKLDPGYTDAYLIVGVNNYVVGSLSWFWKMLAALSGRHGDKDEGLRQVQRVSQQGHYAQEDARLVLAVLYQREKMYAEALPLYQRMAEDHRRNYLLWQEQAMLYGLLDKWPQAAPVYEEMLARQAAAEPGFKNIPLAKIQYLAGQAHEKSGDGAKALALYSQAAEQNAGDKYALKAQLAAAGLEARSQHTAEARRRYQLVLDIAPNSEEAKLASKALKKLPAE